MRIAFFVGRFPVLSEAFILNQITGLIDRGHDVDIYALEGPSNEAKVHPCVETYRLMERVHYFPEPPRNYALRVLEGFDLLSTHGLKHPLTCLRSLNVLKHKKRSASLRLLFNAIPLLNQKPYDIIHCQFGIYALDALMLKQIGALQGHLLSSFRGWDISWFIQEMGERVYDELFEQGDFFLTNCDFFRRRIIRLGCEESKIMVHRSGIDCNTFVFTPRTLDPGQPVRVATTGRLIEKKGIEYGIRGIAIALQSYPNLEYNIIGDGCLRADLERLIQELGVGDRVHLLGWRQQRELVTILDRSHIFIAPSLTAKDGNQDAPVNTLKEAMAMGLPVIATNHGGIPELVEDGVSGFLVAEADGGAIGDRLLHLIHHSHLWPTMGRAGRSQVEAHYDMHKLNDELVEAYRNVLQGTNIPSVRQRQPVAVMQTS